MKLDYESINTITTNIIEYYCILLYIIGIVVHYHQVNINNFP